MTEKQQRIADRLLDGVNSADSCEIYEKIQIYEMFLRACQMDEALRNGRKS